MSLYAKLKEEGKNESKQAVIKHGWLKGYSAVDISDFTGYDINYIKSIIAKLEKEN